MGRTQAPQGRAKKLGTVVVDATGVIQPERNALEHLDVDYPWAWFSPTEDAEQQAAEGSRKEARDIIIRLVSAEVVLVRQGYLVRYPPDGFLLKKVEDENGKKKNIGVTDR
jgi:hypothetical protein